MAGNIQLEVVTPEKAVVNEAVQTVVAPGVLGEFGVLVGHTPFLTTIKTGMVRYIDTEGNENYIFVSGGFAEALPDKLTILAESAEKRQDIDMERAKNSLSRAEKRLAEKESDSQIDRIRAKGALDRAMVRVKIAGPRM
jgi:F-type H+-transporting ATPase subunit epsilon